MGSSQQLSLPGLETHSPFSRKTKHDWSDLKRLYLIEGKSLGEIAKLKGTTDCTVLYALKKQGIPRRTLKEAMALTSRKGKYSQFGKANPAWQEGRSSKTKDGYIYVYLPRSDPFFCMVAKRSRNPGGGGHVLEHRLVMAKAIGKPIKPWQRVHHVNGIKDDNRLENLRFYPWGGHSPTSHYQDRVRDLEARVTLLEAENARLTAILERIGEGQGEGGKDHA